MSTPDPMAQFSQPQPGVDSGAPISLQQGGDAVAGDALARIPKLEQQASDLSAKQGDTGMAQAQDIQSTYQQLEQHDANPPQRNTKIMDISPFLIGLTAIGGRLTGIHAKTMLAATNGMVKGLMQGSDQAYQDAQNQFEQSRKRIMDLASLRQNYYEVLNRAYGDQVNAKEKAIKASRDLVNDGFKHDMDVLKADAQAKALEDKLFMGMQSLDLKALQGQVAQMKEAAQEKHWNKQDDISQQKVTEKSKAGKEAQTDVLSDIQALRQELKDSNGGVAGVRGILNRGMEVAKTATGIGDQSAPAHQFQSRVDSLLLKLPKALTGSSKSAKDERARVDDIANLLKTGTTGPIANQKLDELERIIKHQSWDQQQEDSAGAGGGGIPPQIQSQAEGIRDQVRSGKMTKEQGVAALMKLGGGPPGNEAAPSAPQGGAANTPAADVSDLRAKPGSQYTDSSKWGKRNDGSQKTNGYLGLLRRPDGGVSSEISVGVEINGKETDIPLMVPTLTRQEIDLLLRTPTSEVSHSVPSSIMKKAVAYAKKRASEGKSPFAQSGESPQ